MKLQVAMMSLFFFVVFSVVTASAKMGVYPTKFLITPKANEPMSGGNLVYYGGPVIGNVRAVAVFWTSKVDSNVQKDIGGFYAAIANSTHMDFLDQYATFGKAVDGRQGTNQHIGRGSFVGEFVIQPKNTKTKLDDTEIQAELEYQVSMNTLPKPDNNTLFMIHFPPGVSISIDGMKSCVNFCAYHMGFESKSYGNVFYGVMPDFASGACSFGCSMGNNTFETTTIISAHEFTEAVTDPFPTPGDKPAYPQAWNTTSGEEIADVCPSAADLQSNGRVYKVSKEWDNSKKMCAAGPWQNP